MAVDIYAGQWNPTYADQGLTQNRWEARAKPFNDFMGMINSLRGGADGGFSALGGGSSPAALGDANSLRGLAGNMKGQFGGNLGYADQALKDAFDPHQSQFKQQMADLTDQTRAGEAARGISMSPYGAGVEANTQGRFRNDWQDRQIGREAQGAQTATGLQGQYQSGQMGAASMYAQAAGISQADIGLQLQAYGLQGQQLQAAQAAMLQYLSHEHDIQLKIDEDNTAPWGWGGGRRTIPGGSSEVRV